MGTAEVERETQTPSESPVWAGILKRGANRIDGVQRYHGALCLYVSVFLSRVCQKNLTD